MIDQSRIANPTTHYGKPGSGTRTFKWQRITAACNIAFLAFLIWLVVSLAGTGRAQMAATIGNPAVALALALLVVNVSVHMWIGMREVIEDYVSDGPRHRMAMLANTVFAGVVAVAMLLAILKIAIWG
jgi:succinate dehydrogenase / fumarate reductase membrane anchor subunit